MKEEARKFIFWPQMNIDIEEMAKSCDMCSRKNRQAKEKILEWPEESEPWSRLHIDYAGPIDGKFILVICDAYTKWIDAHVVNTPTSLSTMECLRKTFANFGIPAEVVSDNASYFVSEEIKMFFKKNGIRSVNPSPYHPASNGMGERAVGILKDGLKKFKDGSLSTRLCRILFNYRRTVKSVTKKSPALLMFSREFSSPIEIARGRCKVKNPEMDAKYDLNQAVWVKNFGKGEEWVPGIVMEIKGLRNYVVKVCSWSGDMLWRRHSNHIKMRYNVMVDEPAVAIEKVPEPKLNDDQHDYIVLPKQKQPRAGNEFVKPTANTMTSRSGRSIRPLERLNI